MELVVDLAKVVVTLSEPGDVDRLAVRVGAPGTASDRSDDDVHRLHDVLVAANVGRLVDARQALVRPDAVRFHAAGQVDDSWPERFADLCRSQPPAPRGSDDASLVAPVMWPRATGAERPSAP